MSLNSLVALNEEKKDMYISKQVETLQDKKMIYNAMNNPTDSISDLINKEIKIVDIVMEEIELTETDDNGDPLFDGETGEIIENKTVAVRTILIDDKGLSHQAVSKGIFNSIKQIINIFGAPASWAEPLTVEVLQVKVKKGSMLTLNIK